MDPLTHTLTGLFLGRAGLNRLTPRSTPILLLAANAPDIDIVTTAGGSLNYLHYHRHMTHALAAMPLIAILPVVLVWAVSRKPVHWGGAFLAALVAVASHLALDLTNVYGIRLLLPFSGTWLRLDWCAVIDFWIWGALLLGVAAPFLSHLVTSEIRSGTKRPSHHGRASAIFALLSLLLYDCGRGVLHARAEAVLDSRVYHGEVPSRVVAIPGMNPMRWRGLIETREFYQMPEVDLAGPFDPGSSMPFYKPGPDPAIEAARRNPAFQTFLTFSQFPLWKVTPVPEPQNGKRVEVFDIRFGTPLQSGFTMSGIVDPRGEVVQTSFRFGIPPPR